MKLRFQHDRLPESWWLFSPDPVYDGGYLGGADPLLLGIPVAPAAVSGVTVEVECLCAPETCVHCGDKTFTFLAEPGRGRYRLQHYGKSPMAEAVRLPVTAPAEPLRLAFALHPGRWQLMIDGRVILEAAVPVPVVPVQWLDLGFSAGCRVSSIGLSAPSGAMAPLPRATDAFELEVAVDFADDLMHAPFTREMFAQLFDEFARWGARRCHWVYYGGMDSGWWRHCRCGDERAADHAARTFEQAGDFLSAAVTAAHARGLEVYALIKPFDLGLQYSVSPAAAPPDHPGRLARIGGPVDWMADFVAAHRSCGMARRPAPPPPPVFTRIDLVKEDARPADFSVRDIILWVSDDNLRYRPYTGPMHREERVMEYPRWMHTPSGGRPDGSRARARVMSLCGLELASPYAALQFPGEGGSFANDLLNLVHVFGPDGPTREWTPGLASRLAEVRPDGASALRSPGLFMEAGIEYDWVPGTPTAVFPGYNHWLCPHRLDGNPGFLGMARGRNPDVLAALSPHFRTAREGWLDLVRRALDAGADGVELRVRNHHSPPSWAEFGFEGPVRDEYLARYGTDIWAVDDFDRAAWRRLRGAAYTDFYRAVRALTRHAGRKSGLHVSQSMCLEPELAAAMEIHWDWRTWLSEGLADRITLKEVWPGSRFGAEVLDLAHARRIPSVFSPYANTLWSRPYGAGICDRRIRLARDSGCAGFQLYENAAVMRATSDGRVTMRQPALRTVLQRHFRRT